MSSKREIVEVKAEMCARTRKQTIMEGYTQINGTHYPSG